MREDRKKTEIEFYENKAKGVKEGDFEGFDPKLLSSFRFFYDLISKRSKDKIILDYGCGNGIHSLVPARAGAQKVIGIDLSEKSLELAREKVKRAGLEEKIEFKLMDCEKTDFSDEYFDIIMDGGTFSSLDLKAAYPELKRILKPGGKLIGIETFGHNPFTNLKRKLNKISGKRTVWAAGHIFQEKDLKEAEKYFNKIEAKYFHLVSWTAFPFLKFPGGRLFLKILEAVDAVLLKITFLRKYAFKTVFEFTK